MPFATNNTIQRNNSTTNSQLPVALGANFVTLATTNDTVVKPTFSGTVMIKNADGSNVKGTDFKDGAVPTYTFRLSTYGDSNVTNPQFIIMIPKGFTSSVNGFYLIDKDVGNYFGGVFNGSNQYSTSNYSIEDLGKVGPNEEQLFKIQLDFNPGWNAAQNFGGQFKLTLDPIK